MDENNATGFDTATITAFAVCGKVPGHQIVTSAPFQVFANAQSPAFADCPAGKLPIRRRVLAHDKPRGDHQHHQHRGSRRRVESFINNASPIETTATAYAVCAGG